MTQAPPPPFSPATTAPTSGGTGDVPTPFRLLTPSSMSAVVSIDEQGMVVAWSPEAELVFGWTADDMLGRRLSEHIIPPVYRAAHEAGLRRFRETGAAVAAGRIIEASALRADGTEFPVELSISPPWVAADGRHVFTAFLRDLTERQRLEQLHRMQFQVTGALSEAATLDLAAPAVLAAIGVNIGWKVGILWVLDRDDHKMRMQTLWSRPGIDVAEFAATSRAIAFTPGAGLPGRVWGTGSPMSVADFGEEPAFPRSDSARRAGLRGAVAFPIGGTQGVIGVIEFFSEDVEPPDPLLLTTMSDVGSQLGQFVEHRLAEQLLRRRVHELEVLQQAAHALSASLDPDVVLDAVARSAAEALGAPRSTVLRLDGEELVVAGEYDDQGTSARGRRWPVADLPAAEAVLAGEFWTGGVGEVGPALRQVTELTGVEAVALAPIRCGSGPFGILALLSRTPRVLSASEVRLLQGIASLASLAVGNAESFSLEREHGRRMQALDTAKSQFLNLASHELRSPLTVLRGYMSMIADGSFGELPEGVARVVPMLTGKLAQMNTLIDEMLDTARLEDDRLQLTVEPVDVCEVVRTCVAQAEPSLRPGQHITVDGCDTPVVVAADRTRLATAIKNLVDNALKYSPDGGDVECTVTQQDGAALVSVRDHGLGIAEEDMGRLFTRFGRIVTAENSHILGTGLGLHLARELMRMQGGDITATSTLGEGSTFVLSLPLSPPPAAVSAAG
ncbi:MAG TPA: ATP-binding protein [Candidatus Angelobacter sp.]|nr:ATP-binding protein [Candidatus Angelobacter sp.]